MIRIITIFLGLWVSMLILAPLMVESTIVSLQVSGTAIYFLADPVCHQLPDRCVYIADFPMPICARCFAIYFGGFAIFALAWFKQPQKQWPGGLYIITASLLCVEILTEWLGVYHNNFTLRIISGLIIGAMIFRIILETIVNEKVQIKNG